MRPPGPPKQLEKRRRHAVQLLESGRTLSAVARQVGAAVSSVFRWWRGYAREGAAGGGAQTCPGTSGPTVHRTETPTREAAGPRLAARRLPDRPLDVATG